MKRFVWTEGRQGTGYRKMLLAQGSFWDFYIIDYPTGTAIPTHVDPVPGKKHVRANLRLLGEDTFTCDRSIFRLGPLVIFRSDAPHGVGETSRRRLVLSLGLALDER